MMGAGHRALGAVAASGALAFTDASAPGVRASALVILSAIVTSGGALSPDVDQTGAWRSCTGGRRSCGHRCLTHWWPLPLAMWWVSGRVDGDLSALALGAAIGWGGHLFGDLLFGRGSTRRGPGIPTLTPRGPHVGLALKVGGRAEEWTTSGLRRLAFLVVPGTLMLEAMRATR